MLKFTQEQLSGSFLMLGPGQRAVIHGTIKDDETGEEHEAAVVFGPLGIEIKLDGYGEKCAADGHGSPVYVEVYEGTPVCRVWSDINSEDPTHSIELTNAAEARRFEAGDRVMASPPDEPEFEGEIAGETWETCDGREVVVIGGPKGSYVLNTRLLRLIRKD